MEMSGLTICSIRRSDITGLSDIFQSISARLSETKRFVKSLRRQTQTGNMVSTLATVVYPVQESIEPSSIMIRLLDTHKRQIHHDTRLRETRRVQSLMNNKRTYTLFSNPTYAVEITVFKQHDTLLRRL